MNIRAAIEPVLAELEAEFQKRESELSAREKAIARLEAQLSTSLIEVQKREQSLVEWEATLRDRGEMVTQKSDLIDTKEKALAKREDDFNKWKSMETTRLDNLERKVRAEEQATKLIREQLDTEKKQQDIIKQKLVGERAALDSAWNEHKYNRLRATT